MNARGIPSVQYTQINQLEGLRRMQHTRQNPDHVFPAGTKVSVVRQHILDKHGALIWMAYL